MPDVEPKKVPYQAFCLFIRSVTGRLLFDHIFFCRQICVQHRTKDNCQRNQGNPNRFAHQKVTEHSTNYCAQYKKDQHL